LAFGGDPRLALRILATGKDRVGAAARGTSITFVISRHEDLGRKKDRPARSRTIRAVAEVA